MEMLHAPGAAVPAGAGDLAVAAAFAVGADSQIGRTAADRSDSSSASSSDDEGDDAVPHENTKSSAMHSGDTPEFEFSDEETRRRIPGVIRDGSDSSEWSDSSDEDVEELDLENMPKWLEDIKNNVKSDFDDDAAHEEPPRTKNEIAANAVPPPPPPLQVGQEEALVAVGDVISVVGDVVVVQSLPGNEPLDEESVLCLETRQGMGAIEEVFGPVAAPLYAFRVPTARSEDSAPSVSGIENDEVNEKDDDVDSVEKTTKSKDSNQPMDSRDIPSKVGRTSEGKLDVKVGMRVFAVVGRSRVLKTKGLYSKGYDNSGQNDEEVPDDEEFSDDELEAEAKKKRKQKKRGAEGDADGAGSGAVRDGGFAAAAVAAGGYVGVTGGGPRGGGRGRGGRGGYGANAKGRGFQPTHPPAMQMAYMNVGGAGGPMGFQASPGTTHPGHQVHAVPVNSNGQPLMGPGPPGMPQMDPVHVIQHQQMQHQQMQHQQMQHQQRMMHPQHMMPGAQGLVVMPPHGFGIPQPPPRNWPPGKPWPPQPPSQ